MPPESISLSSYSSEEITLMCSGPEMWGAIRSLATYTNSTTKVHNYTNTGGQPKAKSHFDSMPGTSKYHGDGVYTKSADGYTVTYYLSTSTRTYSLSYPNGTMTDKIRYYD